MMEDLDNNFMCNSIFLGKKTIPAAKDGEEFELTVKGVYHTDEDGVRKLDVVEVDGDEVGEKADCGCGEHEDLMEQDADDALRIFLIKTKKG